MAVDPVADALIKIKNADLANKRECYISPASKLIGNILKIMQEEGYIGTYEYIDDGKAGVYRVELIGKINECKAIKPRYSVRYKRIEEYEKRYLPSKNMGILFISTPEGLMTHKKAKELKIGGKLIGFVY